MRCPSYRDVQGIPSEGKCPFPQGLHLIESQLKLSLDVGVPLIKVPSHRGSNKTRTECRCRSDKGVHPIESQIKLGFNGGVRFIKVSTL